ncbi:GDSL-type esterase/lipase family protein [Leptolyngbya sp. AN02str]|uniref:GDSL-type esterase/lipase family protein n=1 Tax=Leptolyngbya sp. AN02str TaxID=3423363 RepID=UPI003D31471E
MGDRHIRIRELLHPLKHHVHRLWDASPWTLIALGLNGGVALLFGFMSLGSHQSSDAQAVVRPFSHAIRPSPVLGERHQLNYDQWVQLLAQEAQVAATQQPDHLTILLGDSISLWFPNDLLPPNRYWLNQGISGDTSEGVLGRLSLLDATNPQTILLMIGINDLLRGVDDEVILQNYTAIIQYLKQAHPETQIVVQSILPHASEAATWEGRDRLLKIPNDRIRNLNLRLAELAASEGVYFMNLYTLFADNRNRLRVDLSTDGLHLNPQGYLVWRSGLQMYIQQVLEAKG